MIRAVGRIVLAAIVGAVLVAGWASYRIWEVGNRDDRQTVDAIVVLGAAQYNGRPSPVAE